MMDTITIRNATLQDAVGYILLIGEILREVPPVDTPYNADEFNPGVDRIRLRILEATQTPNSCFLVAVEPAQNRIIGSLTCAGGTLKADRHVTTLGIYIAKPWRNQGVGSQLMCEGMTWAKKNPLIQRVELDVSTRNTNAITLYEKFNFVNEGVKRQMYFRHNTWIDMMFMAWIKDPSLHEK